MDKKFIIAVVSSTLLIFLYFTLFPPPNPPPEETKSAAQDKSLAQLEASNDFGEQKSKSKLAEKEKSVLLKSSASPIEAGQRKTVKVEGELYRAEIDSLNGVLTKFELKNYEYSRKQSINVKDWILSLFTGNSAAPLEYQTGRLLDMVGDYSEKNEVWEFESGLDQDKLNFHVSAESLQLKDKPETLVLETNLDKGVKLIKEITFNPANYIMELGIRLENRSGTSFRLRPKLNFGAGNEHVDTKQMTAAKIGISYNDESFEKYHDDDFENGHKMIDTFWAGVMDTYFVMAVKTSDGSLYESEFQPLNSMSQGEKVKIPKLLFAPEEIKVENDQAYEKRFQIYMGPKVQDELEKYDFHLPKSIDLGWFDFLGHPLLALLRWIQGFVVNWGVAIIILTIIVRTAMFPLAFKGMISMRKMGKLNPKIQALRVKYKGDKDKLNQEIMGFYKKHKVNPVGGCLPLVMQVPIFIALYSALMPAIELRHQSFIFWMSDLSMPDFTLILPLLLGVSMFLQQHITPSPAMDQTQAKMMKWMPVMMVFFFLDMPSGLVLYWVTSNILTIFQQIIFNKIKDKEVSE